MLELLKCQCCAVIAASELLMANENLYSPEYTVA